MFAQESVMDIQKLRQEFEKLPDIKGILYGSEFGFNESLNEYYHPDHTNHRLNYAFIMGAWMAWKAQTVPEGFVLVPKENISCYWQDNDEPENFCSNESDFDCLGDCIDLGEIMEINKFTQAHVNKEILFGTWFAEAIDPSEKANFFVGTHAECLEIVAKNKAMIEAQEQSHECQNP